MDRAPLPPHERTWRHPSELAAEERSALQSEVAAPSTRTFAFVTGSAGLLAIALLMLMMAPGRNGQPLVVSATTSPADNLAPTGSTTRIEEVRGFGRTAITPARALATPIGAGHHAIVLTAALPDPLATQIDVELPSGQETEAIIVAHSGGVVVVELAVSEPGHAVADHRPHDREIVTVMSSPPITVAFADVHELEVADGTAVLDSDGELVALCDDVRDAAGVRVVEVSPDVEFGPDDDRDPDAEVSPDDEPTSDDAPTSDDELDLDDVPTSDDEVSPDDERDRDDEINPDDAATTDAP